MIFQITSRGIGKIGNRSATRVVAAMVVWGSQWDMKPPSDLLSEMVILCDDAVGINVSNMLQQWFNNLQGISIAFSSTLTLTKHGYHRTIW